MRKSRTNFGGGFKIPEEYKAKFDERKDAHLQKKLRNKRDDDSNDEKGDITCVTKDEILNGLKLGASDGTLAGGQGGSKGALTNDLSEGLDKDIKKFKMVEENIQNR